MASHSEESAPQRRPAIITPGPWGPSLYYPRIQEGIPNPGALSPRSHGLALTGMEGVGLPSVVQDEM